MNPRKYILLRRFSQLFFFLGLVYIIWSAKYPLNNPVNPSLYFKLDPFVMLATAAAERVFLAGLAYSIFVLILTLVFGRVFCGWFCPLGALQDIWVRFMGSLLRKKYAESTPSAARYVKYYLLGAVSILAAAGIQAAWALDPIAIFVRAFSFNIFPFVNRMIDGSLVFVMKNMENPWAVEKVYYFFKEHIMSLNNPVFPHTAPVFIFLVLVLALSAYKRRFWCRYICPLGALLALVSRFSVLERHAGACKGSCAACRSRCRMNAIKNDNSYLKEECVLCMDCTLRCPGGHSQFVFGGGKTEKRKNNSEKGITRVQFLGFLAGIAVFSSGKNLFGGDVTVKNRPLRPPAALPEKEFVQRCIRCGNCMKVCPTNVLQPTVLEAGLSGVWTPKLDTNIGYCEYKCNLCGQVCPTLAIEPLTVEQKTGAKMGLAEIDQRSCLPWAEGTECIVCEEHCPVADKAIKLTEKKGKGGKIIKLPSVDPYLCVGCAICEFKCPVRPKRAITVKPL